MPVSMASPEKRPQAAAAAAVSAVSAVHELELALLRTSTVHISRAVEMLDSQRTATYSLIVRLAQCIIDGNYSAVLRDNSLVAVEANGAVVSVVAVAGESVHPSAVRAASADTDAVAQFQKLCTGVACLMVFVQANFTGPIDTRSTSGDDGGGGGDVGAGDVAVQLALEGEHVYALARHLTFLSAALQLLVGHDRITRVPPELDAVTTTLFDGCSSVTNVRGISNVLHSADWWAVRCVSVYQRVLSGPCSTLYTISSELCEGAMRCFERVYGVARRRRPLAAASESASEYTLERAAPAPTPVAEAVVNNAALLLSVDDGEVLGRLYTEVALVSHQYRRSDRVREYIGYAQCATGLSYRLAGAYGRNTKHQSFDVPLLVVEAASRLPDVIGDSAPTSTVAATERTLPIVHQNADDTLLESPQMSGVANSAPAAPAYLSVVDQCILLAHCLDVQNRNPAQSALTDAEVRPFVSTVLATSAATATATATPTATVASTATSAGAMATTTSWLVQFVALFLKSRLEGGNPRTIERSTAQLEQLVQHCYSAATSTGTTAIAAAIASEDMGGSDAATAAERCRWVFSLYTPAVWELETEVANRMAALGAHQSALAIFERLQLWEAAIQCLRSLGDSARAVQTARDRIARAPTPLMHCILGDITRDDEQYRLAWELSGERFARAKRSLGHACYVRQEYEACIAHYEAALAVNPHFADAWFALGCAAMSTGERDKALAAFVRVVSQRPNDGDAWCNMAAVHMGLRRSAEALKCYTEALKYKRDSVGVWQSYMLVAVDTANVAIALHAAHELVHTLQCASFNVEAFRVLVAMVLNNERDCDGVGAVHYGHRLVAVLVECAQRAPVGNTAQQLAILELLWQCHDADVVGGGGGGGGGGLMAAHEVRLRQLRLLQAGSTGAWLGDMSQCTAVLHATANMCASALRCGDAKALFAAKMKARSVLKQTARDHADTDGRPALRAALDALP